MHRIKQEEWTCLLIADFNVQNVAACLRNDQEPPRMEVDIAPFGQVIKSLMQRGDTQRSSHPDAVVIWTRPESVIKSFGDVLDYKPVSIEQLLQEVDLYASLLQHYSDQVRAVFVPTWVVPSCHRGLGMLDLKIDRGIARTLMRMNLRLLEAIQTSSNIFPLDSQRWVARVGRDAFNPKLWYMGKIPFGNAILQEAVRDIKSALRGISGKARKLILLDLDDTLWGGAVGDVGKEHIVLGGHDHIGEALVDFQRVLKTLQRRGILLGIVSKNEESVAIDVIRDHPEMLLRCEDFVGWRINWRDKAQNIIELVSELNLNLESVVFIDDNPVERARVREALPEVFVPEWPKDKMLYTNALLNLCCFDVPTISGEDAERTTMYVTERLRGDARRDAGSFDEWLHSLEMHVRVEACSHENVQRITQLLNKTNQMNLSTRRLTEAELLRWLEDDHRMLYAFRVSDKFGDSGLSGIVSLEVQGHSGRVFDFLLSCRVMGRKVEELMLAVMVRHARVLRLREVCAQHIATPRNKPCLDFLQHSGLTYDSRRDCFIWNTRDVYPFPPTITVTDTMRVST